MHVMWNLENGTDEPIFSGQGWDANVENGYLDTGRKVRVDGIRRLANICTLPCVKQPVGISYQVIFLRDVENYKTHSVSIITKPGNYVSILFSNVFYKFKRPHRDWHTTFLSLKFCFYAFEKNPIAQEIQMLESQRETLPKEITTNIKKKKENIHNLKYKLNQPKEA